MNTRAQPRITTGLINYLGGLPLSGLIQQHDVVEIVREEQRSVGNPNLTRQKAMSQKRTYSSGAEKIKNKKTEEEKNCQIKVCLHDSLPYLTINIHCLELDASNKPSTLAS